MPIYEFQCKSCGKTFDKLCSMKDNLNEVACKYCSEKNVIKKMSSFTTSGNRTELNFTGSNSSSCSTCSTGSCSTCDH